MKTKLSANEHIIKQGAANLQKGLETVGGKLFLTNKRLIFEAHIFNIQAGITEIDLSDIQSLEKSWTKFLGFLPVLQNSLAVYTIAGREYRFVLFGRGDWQAVIDENKDKVD